SESSSFFFSRRRRHTIFSRDWSSDVCFSDLANSAFVRDRIERAWGVQARVIYPPVSVEEIQAVTDWRSRISDGKELLLIESLPQIGRASCRERVYITGIAVRFKSRTDVDAVD